MEVTLENKNILYMSLLEGNRNEIEHLYDALLEYVRLNGGKEPEEIDDLRDKLWAIVSMSSTVVDISGFSPQISGELMYSIDQILHENNWVNSDGCCSSGLWRGWKNQTPPVFKPSAKYRIYWDDGFVHFKRIKN